MPCKAGRAPRHTLCPGHAGRPRRMPARASARAREASKVVRHPGGRTDPDPADTHAFVCCASKVGRARAFRGAPGKRERARAPAHNERARPELKRAPAKRPRRATGNLQQLWYSLLARELAGKTPTRRARGNAGPRGRRGTHRAMRPTGNCRPALAERVTALPLGGVKFFARGAIVVAAGKDSEGRARLRRALRAELVSRMWNCSDNDAILLHAPLCLGGRVRWPRALASHGCARAIAFEAPSPRTCANMRTRVGAPHRHTGHPHASGGRTGEPNPYRARPRSTGHAGAISQSSGSRWITATARTSRRGD